MGGMQGKMTEEILYRKYNQKRNARRGDLEIRLCVLENISVEHKPTRLMYLSNLDWTHLQRILDLLEMKRLIVKQTFIPEDPRTFTRVDDKKRFRYFLTSEGKYALALSRGLLGLLRMEVKPFEK